MMNKKQFLDNLYYDVGKQTFDYELCFLGKEGKASKWKKYLSCIDDNKFIEKANNRSIFPNEIVLDIEDPKEFKEIFEDVKKEFNFYQAYKTGSKGYHIHLWFNKEIDTDDKLRIITKFKADKQKSISRCLIALENFPHWKTGINKTLIEEKKGLNVFKEIEIKDLLSSRIKKLIESEKLWHHIVLDELDKKHIGDIKTKEIIFLCCLGRLVKNKKPYSFNCIIHSGSSAGKDHLVSSVLKLFPEQDYETYGRLSPRALNYLHTKEREPFWNYDGKILYLEEIEENVLNNEVMKVFTSGTNKSAIVQDKGALVLEVEGKPVVFTTTATTIPTEEILNRFNILKCDESEEQTRRTFLCEEQDYNEEVLEFLRSLKSYDVEIPKEMINKIAKVFPAKHIKYRRDFPRFKDKIKAVTIFNQFNRKGSKEETLISTGEDYNIAKEIYLNSYSGISDFPLKEIDKKIIKALEDEDKPLSAKEICNYLNGIITIQGLYPHLRNLKNKDILNELTDKDTWNNVLSTYVLSEEFKDKKPLELPNYDEL